MCPASGGNWNNGSNAGVWTLNLNQSRSNSNTNYGFRSDFVSPRTLERDGGTKGGSFLREIAKSAFMALSSRASCIEGQCP